MCESSGNSFPSTERAAAAAHRSPDQEPPRATLAERSDRKGQRDEPKVECQARVGDVAAIEMERLAGRAGADDLRQPGEAGTYGPAKIKLRRRPAQPPHVDLRQRTRADRTQLAAQDVDELWKLVEAGGTQ